MQPTGFSMLRKRMADSLTTGRRDRGRRRQRRYRPEVGAGAPRLEFLEDRTLLSHFRFGTMSWETVLDEQDQPTNTVQFTIEQSWRGGFWGWNDLQVGDTTPGSVTSLILGDGQSAPVQMEVLSVHDDWFYGRSVIEHTYSEHLSGQDVEAFMSGGNFRLGYSSSHPHVNNPNVNFRMETIVNVGTANSSPVTSLPPIVQVPDDQIVTFQIPGADPDGDPITYRLATAHEAARTGTSGFPDSRFTQPDGLIVSSDGLVTWDIRDDVLATNPGELWSVQVMLEDGQTKTPVDFFIEIGESAAVNAPPEFDHLPGALQPIAGQPLSFEVQASDPDVGDGFVMDTVSLEALNAPSGMTFTEIDPAPDSRPNAVRLRADWTPTTQQAGQSHVITFQATDSRGATTSDSVTLTPILPNQSPEADAGGPYTISVGDPLTLDASGSSDPGGDPLTYSWTVNGTPIGGTADNTLPLSWADLQDLGITGGSFTVSVQVSNGTDTDTASTTLTVEPLASSLGDLASPSILIGTQAATVGGAISSTNPDQIPSGSVVVTVRNSNGDIVATESADINPDGSFATNVNTTLMAAGIYAITYDHAGDSNFEASTGAGTLTIAYQFDSLNDPNRPIQAGRTLPIRLQLFDANGENLSSSGTDVTAVRLERFDPENGSTTTVSEGPVQAAGNSNPESLFRYDAKLEGYIFNLQTDRDWLAGEYRLRFQIGTDLTLHTITFHIR